MCLYNVQYTVHPRIITKNLSCVYLKHGRYGFCCEKCNTLWNKFILRGCGVAHYYIFLLCSFSTPYIHTHRNCRCWFVVSFLIFFPFIIHVNRVSTRKSVNNLVDIMRYHQRLTNSLIYYRKRNVTYLTFYIGKAVKTKRKLCLHKCCIREKKVKFLHFPFTLTHH